MTHSGWSVPESGKGCSGREWGRMQVREWSLASNSQGENGRIMQIIFAVVTSRGQTRVNSMSSGGSRSWMKCQNLSWFARNRDKLYTVRVTSLSRESSNGVWKFDKCAEEEKREFLIHHLGNVFFYA